MSTRCGRSSAFRNRSELPVVMTRTDPLCRQLRSMLQRTEWEQNKRQNKR